MVRRVAVLSQLVPPRPAWAAEMIPDQKGKVALITGGHRDIGREIAKALLLKGAKVYIATATDEERIQTVIYDLKEETGKECIYFLNLDLGDLNSIEAAAQEFIGRETELHTLYNNAAISYAMTDRETTQGYGLQFGTNVLGHFYLTKLLLPLLTSTARSSPPGTVRVINHSSIVHYMAVREGIRWSTINKGGDAPAARKTLGIARLNGQSRLGTILFSNELARRYEDQGIVSISLYPGAINADFSGATTSFLMRIRKMLVAIICFILEGGDLDAVTDDVRHHASDGRSPGPIFNDPRPSQGPRNYPLGPTNPLSNPNNPTGPITTMQHNAAELSKTSFRTLTSLYAGTDPTASDLNGRYLTAWARRSLPHRKALDRDLAAKLWDWCEEQVKDRKPIEHVREDTLVAPATEPGPVKEKGPVREEPEPLAIDAKEPGPVKEKEPVREEPEPLAVDAKEPGPVKEKEQAKDEDVKAKE